MKYRWKNRKTTTIFTLGILIMGALLFTKPVEAATTVKQSKVTVDAGKTKKLSSSGVPKVYPTRVQTKAKSRADYIRLNNFKYGDARINPVFNDSERTISCDRYVQWVFGDLGYTDLPVNSGLVVYRPGSNLDMSTWLAQHDAKKITSKSALAPGDIVFLGPNGIPGHVFILGKNQGNGNWERYDFGNISRFSGIQPYVEPVDYANNPFAYAYRLPTLKVSWSSSNQNIATVDSSGNVTGINSGTCTITGSNGSSQIVYQVTVSGNTTPSVTSVSQLPSTYTGYAMVAGKKLYIKNGKKFTGIAKINGIRYYIKKGLHLTGYRKIKAKKYYYKGGRLYTGYRKISGTRYYIKKGVKLTGYRKIKGKKYYYRQGRLYTGYRTSKTTGKRVYYRKGRKV